MGGGTGGGGMTDGGVPSCSNITGDRQTQVCLRWTCDRADMSEGIWNGSVPACMPGDLTVGARANALKLLNTYRFIADLPPVVTSATRDQAAQECALIQDAANMLSHYPDAGTPCYTDRRHGGEQQQPLERRRGADRTGWTLQTYATADNLTNAVVTITDNGTTMPVTVSALGANYGSRYAIRWVPMGWVSQVGHSYAVNVTAPGMAVPIDYTVDVVACP